MRVTGRHPSRREGKQQASARIAVSELGIGSVEKVSLTTSVYARLKTAIMSGKLVPGKPVAIRSLASSLGTSAIPVREALSRLNSEGALEIRPNGSVCVPAMTRARFFDLRATRVVLEGFAVELTQGESRRRTLKRVEKLFDDTVAANEKGDPKRFFVANQKMRFAIYQAARSATLMPIIESLWLQAGPFFNIVYDGQAFIRESLGFDRSALDALHKQDARSARIWIEHDIIKSGDVILSLLKESEEQ